MLKQSLAILSGLLLASTAQAVTVTFDEVAYDNTNGAIPAARYAALGVTFVGTDDGSTLGGNSNGNPGSWNLEGTNGPGFSGFNGQSSTQTLTFAGPLSFFSLDASRSNGSSDGVITLQAFNGASLVGSTNGSFGALNEWLSLSLTGTFDRVVYTGTGTDFHPFGVDNLNWRVADAVPEPATWALIIAGFGLTGATARRRTKVSMHLA